MASPLPEIAAGMGWSQLTYFTQVTDRLLIAKTDPRRWYLGIYTLSGNTVQVTTATGPIPISLIEVTQSTPLHWEFPKHGPLAQAAWYLLPQGGSIPVAVFEVWKI